MDAQIIRALLTEQAQQVQIEVVEETGSTNQDVLKRAANDSTAYLLIAKKQTAGRGRAGRTWHSDSGDVLTFTLGWSFDGKVNDLLGLPLAVGVAVTEVLSKLGLPVQLKWPNDILKDKKKLAGILLEITTSSDGKMYAAIGIGINLQIPESLEQRIGHTVADAPWLAQMDRNQLLAQLLNALTDAMLQFQHTGFAPFAQRWNALHAYANQAVEILENGKSVHEGVALGVNEQGYLLLQTVTGVLPIIAGDVSLRPAQ